MLEQQASLRTFAWLSHERPQALKRSVQSFVSGCSNAANNYRFIIAESGAAQKYPDYLPTKNLTYIDDAFRDRMIQFLEKNLVAQGANPQAIRFALDGRHSEGSEGVHRNAIALLTQGELFASSDDDIIFDIQALPTEAKQNVQAGQSNFLPFKNFDTLDAFQGHPVSLDNFIAIHEKALQSATFSSPGIRGDSAYGGPRFIFTFEDASLVSFCQNSEFVKEALGSRVMWRETAKSHLTSYASLATYMLAMNNQQGLAPCFPFGRNLDGAFIYATKALYPHSQTAQLSMSVLHRPLTDRGSYSSLESFQFRINDYLWLMWSEWLESQSSSLLIVDRHAAAATYFQNIAAQSAESFREYLIHLTMRSLLDRAHRLEKQIERIQSEHQAPGLSSWVELAEQEVQLCRQISLKKELLLPEESRRQGGTTQDRLEVTRKWIMSYGQLLEVWPLMRTLMNTFKQGE